MAAVAAHLLVRQIVPNPHDTVLADNRHQVARAKSAATAAAREAEQLSAAVNLPHPYRILARGCQMLAVGTEGDVKDRLPRRLHGSHQLAAGKVPQLHQAQLLLADAVS